MDHLIYNSLAAICFERSCDRKARSLEQNSIKSTPPLISLLLLKFKWEEVYGRVLS